MSKTSDEYQAGLIAKSWLIDRVENQQVILTTKRTGKHGRWLATLRDDNGANLNEEMIEPGLASPDQ